MMHYSSCDAFPCHDLQLGPWAVGSYAVQLEVVVEA